jgi:CheY-like chemotaxis protein
MAVILIVEDDVLIREIAELMVQDFGYDTLVASDVEEALKYLRSSKQIDALFTDIYLKKLVLGGCELGIEAVKLRPGLRVLYTTGNVITTEMTGMFVDGKHFLKKPYTQIQLHDSVDEIMPL